MSELGREVREWVGRTPDSKIPPAVKVRVLLRYDRTCALSKQRIRSGDTWDVDHIKELWEGGENRESNLQPVLKEPHKKKSAEGRARKAKSDATIKHHYGIDEPKQKINSRGFRKRQKKQRFDRTPLSPRQLYQNQEAAE